MLTATKRIIIASEGINGYSFRTLIDGIDLTQFTDNPIMLWMHNRAFGVKQDAFLPIGNVIDLRKEVMPGKGLCLTGQPVFDDTDNFAVSIYHKYENGTIRSASAGLVPVEWSHDPELSMPGQRGATLVKSVLEEVSIVDIGSDPNAVAIALYDDNHKLLALSATGDNANIPLLTPIIEIEMNKIELTAERAAVLLGLKAVPAITEIETKIAEVVQLAQSQKTQIEALIREKDEAELKLAAAGKQAVKDKAEVLLSQAIADRKITADEKPFYADQIADQQSFDRVKLHLDAKKANPSVQAVITGAEQSNEITKLCAQSFDELFANGDLAKVKLHAPVEYKRIYKDKFGKDPKA